MASDLVNMNMSNAANYARCRNISDIDNFIDYMMLNIWCGDRLPGKIIGVEIKIVLLGPYRFYSWDSEWSWDVTKDFDDVSGAWVHPDHRAGSTESDFNPKFGLISRKLRIYDALCRQRYMHCFNDGVLTDSASLALEYPQSICADAMIAESAKWGDAMEVRDEPLFKRDIHWQAEVDAIAALMDGNVA
ncbi:MAG: hypothetical protein R3C26_21870 [Calditrichia bacterium]